MQFKIKQWIGLLLSQIIFKQFDIIFWQMHTNTFTLKNQRYIVPSPWLDIHDQSKKNI